MKNLLNTIVFKSVALFAMIMLVAFAVTTSFNPLDQSSDIGGKSKDIIKHVTDYPITDIGGGGKGTSTTLKEDIGGSKGIKGEFISNKRMITDIGGRNSTTTGNFSVDDIGGRNGTGTGTSTGGEFQITDIGGRTTNTSDVYSHSDIGGRNSNGTGGEYTTLRYDIGGRGNELGTGNYFETSTDEYFLSDIGGRKDINTGNLTFDTIGGSRDHVIIRRIPIPFTSEIGGRSTTIGQ